MLQVPSADATARDAAITGETENGGGGGGAFAVRVSRINVRRYLT
jgi:hypothetical protein